MNGLINYWIQDYYMKSKNEGKSDRIISKELGVSERTLRRRKKSFNDNRTLSYSLRKDV